MDAFYAALQRPISADALHFFTSFSEQISPAVRSKVIALSLSFEARAKLPGMPAVSLEIMTRNDSALTFPEANEEQLRGIVFLVVMQTLQSMQPRIPGVLMFSKEEMGQMKMRELANARSKALEILSSMMEGIYGVRKAFADDLK
jgi:hypothetical protein